MDEDDHGGGDHMLGMAVSMHNGRVGSDQRVQQGPLNDARSFLA